MKQRDLWNLLVQPGLIALVGAGGKTTVLTKLVEYGCLQGYPVMVTTTTQMYETQVAQWKPYYGTDFDLGLQRMRKSMDHGRAGAWFSGMEGTKVLPLEPTFIDDIYRVHPNWLLLVEADGAKEKWIKAPRTYEPIIPKNTTKTIGIVNLQVLGKPIEEEYVHHVDEMVRIMDAKAGDLITPKGLAQFIMHGEGLFQYRRGEKILFCTGYDTVDHGLVDQVLTELETFSLERIFLADGYKASCEIRRVLQWQ